MNGFGATYDLKHARNRPMKGCLIAIGIVAGLVLIGISSCWLAYGPTHIRYRLTIEAKDGDVVRSGSSVIEVAYRIAPSFAFGGGPQIGVDVHGNAVTVNLGPKGVLFAIFRVDDSGMSMGEIPIEAYGLKKPGDSPELLKEDLTRLRRKSGSADVPKDVLPTLIRFRNIDDPNSAGKVDPSDLAASFGAGVELKSVKIELTNDPITPVPAVWPAWLKELGADEYVNHSATCGVNPFCLQGIDFKGS